MKKKTVDCLETTVSPMDILEISDEEMTLLEPAETELVFLELSNIVNEQPSTTRRASSNIESRIESTLAVLIEKRMQTKALPLALRKRLMYQRAISA